MKLSLYTYLLLLIFSCGTNNSSDISHQDNPENRGGEEELPWHFHTGTGSVISEFGEGADAMKIKSSCTLSELDSECKEKVYFFKKSEIMLYVNKAKEAYRDRLESATAKNIAAGTIAVISGKTAVTGFLSPDPTVSKVVAVGAAVSASISGIVVAWQGKKMVEILISIQKLNDLIADHSKYVTRCGHAKKDFLKEAQKLGVTIVFPQAGGSYIDGTEYLNSMLEEKELYKQTIQYALDNNITSRKAYSDYFQDQCGQLPMIHDSKVDYLFAEAWRGIPEVLKQKTIQASQDLDLKSGALIEFSKFDDNDLLSIDAIESVQDFLGDLSDYVSNAEVRNDLKLQKLRREIDGIIIQPAWKGLSFFSIKDSYRTQTIDGKRYLFLNAFWSWKSNRYEISMKEYLDSI